LVGKKFWKEKKKRGPPNTPDFNATPTKIFPRRKPFRKEEKKRGSQIRGTPKWWNPVGTPRGAPPRLRDPSPLKP